MLPMPQLLALQLLMFKNYFKTARRSLLRNKAHSFINITGLSVGIAVALLIGLWVWDELSFNRNHENFSRIAQVYRHANYEGKKGSGKYLPYPLTLALKTNYSQHFKHIITAQQAQSFDLSAGEIKIAQKGQFIDDGAPEMLTLNMLKGSRAGLKQLNSIMLSASTAKALFGGADPMNQAIKINNRIDVTVTGVYEDLPMNSEFHSVKFFAPFELDLAMNPWIKEQSWDNQFIFTYVELQPNTSFEKVSAAIANAEMDIIKNLENFKKQAARQPAVFLHPMDKWHLYGDFTEWVPDRAAVRFVWLVGAIGAFVLLLACINFMNLSTARSEKRAKEVGIRKTIGSVRSQLILQFFSESFLVVLIAFGIALVLVSLSLPWFNQVAEKEMTIHWTNAWFWFFACCFILITGLLAGSYPALYLSSFRPVKVLKGTFRVGKLAAIPRKALVVTQFSISILFFCMKLR